MQQQTLKRKRLIELHNQFSCQTWRENIVEILDTAPILATDDTDIVIPQAKIDLLLKQGSKEQKEASGIKLIQFKENDWVVVTGTDSYNFGKSAGPEKPEINKAYQIKEAFSPYVTLRCDKEHIYIAIGYEDIRPATKEEISIATCPYKVGDYLYCKERGYNNACHPDYDGNGAFSRDENNIQKITKLEVFEGQLVAVGHLGGVARIERRPNAFRLANQDEIEQLNSPYKDGELIWVGIGDVWQLRYSTGKVENNKAYVYYSQEKSGDIICWPYHQKATGIVLPPKLNTK